MIGQCPVCKGYFGIQQEWVGQEAQCPHCQQTITVQTVETSGKDLSTETEKTNVLSRVLLIIGIIIYCGNYLVPIANRVLGPDYFESSFFKLCIIPAAKFLIHYDSRAASKTRGDAKLVHKALHNSKTHSAPLTAGIGGVKRLERRANVGNTASLILYLNANTVIL